MTDEYIRKTDVKDALHEKVFHNLTDEFYGAMQVLDELPPADVVQVVRCENCVHWSDSNQCERPELTGNRWHDDKYFETLPDDFCSYGERKED
jgi:hypothetical protein